MLTAPELAQMRTVIATTLQGTAYILRATNVSDDQGGSTSTWGTAGTVSCHLSPTIARGQNEEDVMGGRIAAESTHVFTCSSTTDLRTVDRVKDAGTGTEYEVLSVSTPRTWALSLRAGVKRID